MINTQKNQAQGRIIPLADWPKFHPWPPLGGLRHLAFHAKTNGFDKVLHKVGSRVLIDEDAFFQWVTQNNSKKENK